MRMLDHHKGARSPMSPILTKQPAYHERDSGLRMHNSHLRVALACTLAILVSWLCVRRVNSTIDHSYLFMPSTPVQTVASPHITPYSLINGKASNQYHTATKVVKPNPTYLPRQVREDKNGFVLNGVEPHPLKGSNVSSQGKGLAKTITFAWIVSMILTRVWGGLPCGTILLFSRIFKLVRIWRRPAFDPDLVPYQQPAMAAASGMGIPDPRRVFDQRRARTLEVVKAIGTLAAYTCFWVVTYNWFFRAIDYINEFVLEYPEWEVLTYTGLALPPLVAVRSGIFAKSIAGALKAIVAIAPGLAAKHVVRSMIDPLSKILQSILLFVSFNLFVNATPEDFEIALPEQYQFIDPDGDGVLTAQEIQDGLMQTSTGLLFALMSTFFGWFLWKAKAPPEEIARWEKDQSWTPQNALQQYWFQLSNGRGFPVIVDLLLSVFVISIPCSSWFNFLHISAETVLTFGGMGGIALGLASQSVVGNMVSGLLLLVTQPFTVGDEITSGDNQGRVQSIGWSSTTMESLNGATVFIPNQSLIDQDTINLSVGEAKLLTTQFAVRFKAGQGGSAKCKKLIEAIEEVMREDPNMKGFLTCPPGAYLDFQNGKPIISIEAKLQSSEFTIDDMTAVKSSVLVRILAVVEQLGGWIPGMGMYPQGDSKHEPVMFEMVMENDDGSSPQ
uniref:Mechanosensitive ion channel MscS domain-containing protein n=1 Tax=Eutreptiella gymnastica TaxID=73025 RepID=A0A7S1N6D2_9EUGL|mmetsp:Transcript_126395/g.218995  ORF Transcript_126395/g.218995 Transcript_126395/m.218995 type:complete len:671 (+) Transcript_126395:2-2014(+)